MKPAVRFGLIFGMVYVIARLLFHNTSDFSAENSKIFPIANMLLVMLAILAGIIAARKNVSSEDRTFLGDFKSGMQAAGMYIIVYIGFYLIFYNIIAPNFMEMKVEAGFSPQVELFNNTFADSARVITYEDGLMHFNKELATSIEMPKDTIAKYSTYFKDGLEGLQDQYSVKNDLSVSVLGLFVLSMFYSIFISVIVRKVLSKIL